MKRITGYAYQNRRFATPAEKELKRKLKRWKIHFKSQRPFDYYIVDILLPFKRLAIEVDGEYHANRKVYDERRTAYLESLGLQVIRISNKEVLETDCEDLRRLILTIPEIQPGTLHWKKVYGQAKY